MTPWTACERSGGHKCRGTGASGHGSTWATFTTTRCICACFGRIWHSLAGARCYRASALTQVLLLLGRLQLDKGEWTKAKEVFLQACRLAPSCSSWLGAGTACLRLKHRAEAEECLSEANVLNNREPAAWGQLALLCVQQERLAEAEQALHHALKLELPDAALLT